MSGRGRALAGVAIMSALLVLYFAFVLVRAVALLRSGTALAVIMGAALIVLPLIGAWALLRELRFGYEATRLTDRLAAEGALPDEEVDALPSGRPDREQAESVFPRYRRETEAAPSSWRAWMRLGIVYDACGDRKRARRAIREAISLYRNEIGDDSSKD